MPAGSVAGHVEASLKATARKKGYKGRRAASYIYGTLNKAGLMHGNQVTPKGMKHYVASRRAAGRH